MHCEIKLICCDNETEIIYGYKLVLALVLTTIFFLAHLVKFRAFIGFILDPGSACSQIKALQIKMREKIATRKPTVHLNI